MRAVCSADAYAFGLLRKPKRCFDKARADERYRNIGEVEIEEYARRNKEGARKELPNVTTAPAQIEARDSHGDSTFHRRRCIEGLRRCRPVRDRMARPGSQFQAFHCCRTEAPAGRPLRLGRSTPFPSCNSPIRVARGSTSPPALWYLANSPMRPSAAITPYP